MFETDKAGIICQLTNGQHALLIYPYDGYPEEGIGEMLLREYNSYELAEKLTTEGLPEHNITSMHLVDTYYDALPLCLRHGSEFVYYFIEGRWRIINTNNFAPQDLDRMMNLELSDEIIHIEDDIDNESI